MWVVGTPIGNLEDITLRALRVLREADLVVAEDTRHTRALLRHHGVETALSSLHGNSPDAKVDRLVERLREGARLALVSDAGCPVVSDPGGRLVSAARREGLRVESVPGPSAVTAGLSVAGLRADSFRFVGFLPRSGARRRRALAALAADTGAVVFFESPRRMAATLDDLRATVPERRLAVCRELTKLHEEVARGTAAELIEHFASGVRGELTVIVEATEGVGAQARMDLDQALEIAQRALASGERMKDVARALAAETELSGREAYAKLRELSERA